MKDPWLAVVLSNICPGAGQIYAGKKSRGCFFIFVAIGSFISFLAAALWVVRILSNLDLGTVPIPHLLKRISFVLLIPLFSFFFWLYNLFDAYRLAQKCNGIDFIESPAGKKKPFLAVFLSMMLPGLGQIYNSQRIKGVAILIFFISFAWIDGKIERMDLPFENFLYLTYALFGLLASYDAYAHAERINGRDANILSHWSKRQVCGILLLWVAANTFGMAGQFFITHIFNQLKARAVLVKQNYDDGPLRMEWKYDRHGKLEGVSKEYL